ncbi:hypothetical protein NVP1244A_047 [Vibrio phage 1.244.A._10N.261.54.C3]|nr:hypothetical protein NVP1244A_047 [Vibrio phage 1.244.A._10N.261.54.C3]AUR98675.1 hypothetical protein NVP1255O_047 [Vibrio phage 1.255.O._10N.286.45.F1]
MALTMAPERWGKFTEIQKMCWRMAERFQEYRCHGNIKNLPSRHKCPHVVVDMLDDSRVSLTYFAKRKEVQVFDCYGKFKGDQNIWTFKEWTHAVDFVIGGLESYDNVIEHRVRHQDTNKTTYKIRRKEKGK